MRTKLEDDAIQRRLGALDGWRRDGPAIRKSFRFADFAGALRFVNRVGDRAEALDHHPDIDIRFDRVHLALSTHDAGGITARDFELAGEIDELERDAPSGGNPLA